MYLRHKALTYSEFNITLSVHKPTRHTVIPIYTMFVDTPVRAFMC